MLKEAKEKLPQAKLIIGSLPTESNFDLIISNFALQWFKNPAFTLNQCMKKLTDNGILAVSFPIEGTLSQLANAANDCNLAKYLLNYQKEEEIQQMRQVLS